MEVEPGELTVPQELKDVPIPPDSDSGKRRPMKASTAAASSGSSQMVGSRAVAETPTQQISTTDESRMDVEGERDESISSKAQNTRRQITTKTSMDENNSDERTVAVTTHQSSGAIRERAMRIASVDELETGSSAGRWSSPGGAANDKTQKANELVRDLSLKRALQTLAHEICRRCEESRVSVESVHQQ